jgi:predicted nucleic acid-binding protein
MVVQKKFPKKMNVIEEFLNEIPFESSYTPKEMDMNLFAIRDVKDYPVLYSAINDNVDIFITGDKDFFDSINVEKPEIITPKDFLKKYCND